VSARGRPSLKLIGGLANDSNNPVKRKNKVPRMPIFHQAAISMPLDVRSLTAMVTTARGVAFLSRTLDSHLHAYDKRAGERLWRTRFPGLSDPR
jgi:glucose dehydrogenase